MPAYEYEYKGYAFGADHELSAAEWKQTLAYFDSLSPKEQPKEETSALKAFGKSAVESTVPATTGLYAAGQGARLGFAIPAPLPAKVLGAVAGGLVGGIGGGMLGEEAQQFVGQYIPEGFKEQLGFGKEQRAQETTEHPYASFAGQLAPNLAFFRPGAVAPIVDQAGKTILGSSAQRAMMGAAGGGIEAGTELATEGKIDPLKVGMAGAFQAAAPVSTKLGKKVFGEITPSGTPERTTIDPATELKDKAIYIERVMPEVEAKIEVLKTKLETATNEGSIRSLTKQLNEEQTILGAMRQDLQKIRDAEVAGVSTEGDVIPPKVEEETPPKTNVEGATSDQIPVGDTTTTPHPLQSIFERRVTEADTRLKFLQEKLNTETDPAVIAQLNKAIERETSVREAANVNLEGLNQPDFVMGGTATEVHANFLRQLDSMEQKPWSQETLDRVIANKESKLENYSPETQQFISKEIETLKAIKEGKMTVAEAIDNLSRGDYDAIGIAYTTRSAITPELQAAVKTNNILDGLRAIANSADVPQTLRNISNRLLNNKAFGKFTNIFYDNQIKHGMQTSRATGDISVRSASDVNSISYVHESLHSATSGAMLEYGRGRNRVSPTVAKAMDNIMSIYDDLKGRYYNNLVKALDGNTAMADLLLSNERELLSYALTDETFRNALNTLQVGKKSFLGRLFENIADALGMSSKQDRTMFDSLYESGMTLIDEYQGRSNIGVAGFDPIYNYRDKDGDIGIQAADKFVTIAKRFLSPYTFKNFWRGNKVISAVTDLDAQAQRSRDRLISLVLHGDTNVEQYKKLGFLQRLDRATSPEGLTPAMQQLTNKELGEVIPVLLLGERDGLDAHVLIAEHGATLSEKQKQFIIAQQRASDLLLLGSNEMLSARNLPETQYRKGYFLKSSVGDNILTALRDGVVTRMEFYLTKAEQERAAKRLSDEGYTVELSKREPNVDYEGILQTLNDILEQKQATGIPVEELVRAKTETLEQRDSSIGGHKMHRGFLRGFAGDVSALSLEENGKAFRHSLESNVKSYANLIYKRQLAYDTAMFFNGEGRDLIAKQPNAFSVARYYLDNALGTLQSPAEGKISGTVNQLMNEAFAKAFPSVHLERDVIPYAYNLLTRGAYNMVLTSAPVTWVTQALGFLQSGRMLFKDQSNPMFAAAAIGKALSNVFFKQYSDDALQGMHYIAQNTEVFHKHMTSEVADFEWSSDKKTITNKLYHWFSGEVFTSAGDAFSRVVAWNMANELLLRSNPELTPIARWEKAGEMTAESMIKMGRENLPGMYKELGFIGSAISPLKSYLHGQVSNLAVDVKDVVMNRDAASMMALAMNGLGMMVVGGGLSLPFLADYEYLRQAAVKHGFIAPTSLPNWTRFMAEQDPVISRGLISGLTGIDLGASMRYQSIMKPFAETVAPDSIADAILPLSSAVDFASGAGTIVKNAFGGASDEQVDKALEKVLPRGYIRGSVDALRNLGKDKTTVGERGEAFVERGTPEILAKIMGSKSVAEADMNVLRNERMMTKDYYAAQKQKAVDMLFSEGHGDKDVGRKILADLVIKGQWTPDEIKSALINQLDKRSRTWLERELTNKRGEVKSMAQKRALTDIIQLLGD